jgi:Neuraminidase (sialidase)
MYLVYEKETRDKSNSSIMVSVSEDKGRTWKKPQTILDCVADQEPAGLVKTEKGWNLYYSSDVANPGQSYDGAAAYIARLSEELEVVEKDIRVDLATPVTNDTETSQKGGILLYSVESFNDRTYYAYSEDHASADNLCVSASSDEKKKK